MPLLRPLALMASLIELTVLSVLSLLKHLSLAPAMFPSGFFAKAPW
ncbi:hypothetical protein [Cloacibacillus evryensis]|nr:hypothetical protein [Cloacibacillus evryensis]